MKKLKSTSKSNRGIVSTGSLPASAGSRISVFLKIAPRSRSIWNLGDRLVSVSGLCRSALAWIKTRTARQLGSTCAGVLLVVRIRDVIDVFELGLSLLGLA